MTNWIDRLQGINLYLIGMMGSGKTTVGQRLAQQFGYQFFDTDIVIEQATGQTVSEIFATAGESKFRELETQVLSELSAYRRLIIATGGGIVLQRMNWSYLRHGIVIWLDVPIAEIYNRLQGDTTRPLLQGDNPLQKLESILSQRESLYAQADIRITFSKGASADWAVDRILEEIPNILKPEMTPSHLSD